MPKRRHSGVPIDHSRVIDGFGELRGRTSYEDFEVDCGRCGTRFVFTAAGQKHVHETVGVPVKMARRGAALCPSCRKARGQERRHKADFVQTQQRVEAASLALKADPSNPRKLLEYLEAFVDLLAQRPSETSAQRLITETHRIRKLDPSLGVARYWEARLHESLGDAPAALAAYEAFVLHPGKGVKRLVKDAQEAIDRLR